MHQKNILPALIIILVFLSPWFWHLRITNFFYLSINQDIQSAKEEAHLKRSHVLNNNLSPLFLNWPTEFLRDRLQIMMENLDIGNYFFSGHPRERGGVFEIQKFFMFQLVLLVIGLTNSKLRNFGKFLIIYSLCILLLSAIFKWREFDKTIFFMPPFILIMALGLEKIFNFHKKWVFLFFCLTLLEILVGLIFYLKGLLQ